MSLRNFIVGIAGPRLDFSGFDRVLLLPINLISKLTLISNMTKNKYFKGHGQSSF